jgi:hypothetical protein
VVNELTKEDRGELAKLMGISVKLLQPKFRPENGKPAAKPKDHQALAMPYNPDRPRWNSPEVLHFLNNRKPARPDTLQVILVLRDTSR